MALTKGFGGHLSVTLREKVFSNQSLNVAGVARDALCSGLVSRSRNPVFGVLGPVAINLFVELVPRSFLAVNSGCHCPGRSEPSQVPSFSISLDNGLVDGSSSKPEQVVLRRHMPSVARQVLLAEASVLCSHIPCLCHIQLLLLKLS